WWPAARTTTTGPSTARATIPTVRPRSVDPCHSRAALGVPIREDRPPASTTPAQAITSPGYASRRIGRVRVAPDPAELPAGSWPPTAVRARWLLWTGAGSDVECQLGQAAGSPAAAVAR